jgi:flagellar hook assembly protein FlgD
VSRPGYDQPPVFVRIRLSTPGYCSVKIYNSAGEMVRTLWSRPIQSSLEQDLDWDGKNMYGAPVASGVYVIYYTNRYKTQMAKLLVIR